MAAGSTQMASTEFTNPNLEVLYSAGQIAERIAELGEQITRDFTGRNIVLVSVLEG